MDSQRNAPIYNIKAVAHLTNVPADTLRRWESRYGVIVPQRTGSGYRLYSQRDVDTILWLKAKLEEGLSISRACDMLRQMGGDPGRQAPLARGAPLEAEPASYPRAGQDMAGVVRSIDALSGELLDAFRAVSEERAGAVLTEALGLYPTEEVCLGVIQPALVAIGELWLDGKVSVAVEHFASSLVRSRLANLLHSSPHSAAGPLVLVGCAPEEFHELGALFLALFLRRAGMRVVYLGQNVPLDSLQGMIRTMRPEAVCISATRAESAASLIQLRDSFDALEKEGIRAPLLAYGGQVFNRFPHITERLGGVYLGENAGLAVRKLIERMRPGLLH